MSKYTEVNVLGMAQKMHTSQPYTKYNKILSYCMITIAAETCQKVHIAKARKNKG